MRSRASGASLRTRGQTSADEPADRGGGRRPGGASDQPGDGRAVERRGRIALRLERERREDDPRQRPRAVPELVRDDGRAREQEAVAADRALLGPRELEHMAELAPPRRAERPVAAHEVVQVRDDRLREVTSESRRRDLLEMDDVRLGGSGSRPGRQTRSARALERPRQAEQPAGASPGGSGSTSTTSIPSGRISGNGPLLPRGEHAQVDAVLAQAADQRQRAAARGASFRERRLGQDEQRPHAASASR